MIALLVVLFAVLYALAYFVWSVVISAFALPVRVARVLPQSYASNADLIAFLVIAFLITAPIKERQQEFMNVLGKIYECAIYPVLYDATNTDYLTPFAWAIAAREGYDYVEVRYNAVVSWLVEGITDLAHDLAEVFPHNTDDVLDFDTFSEAYEAITDFLVHVLNTFNSEYVEEIEIPYVSVPTLNNVINALSCALRVVLRYFLVMAEVALFQTCGDECMALPQDACDCFNETMHTLVVTALPPGPLSYHPGAEAVSRVACCYFQLTVDGSVAVVTVDILSEAPNLIDQFVECNRLAWLVFTAAPYTDDFLTPPVNATHKLEACTLRYAYKVAHSLATELVSGGVIEELCDIDDTPDNTLITDLFDCFREVAEEEMLDIVEKPINTIADVIECPAVLAKDVWCSAREVNGTYFLEHIDYIVSESINCTVVALKAILGVSYFPSTAASPIGAVIDGAADLLDSWSTWLVNLVVNTLIQQKLLDNVFVDIDNFVEAVRQTLYLLSGGGAFGEDFFEGAIDSLVNILRGVMRLIASVAVSLVEQSVIADFPTNNDLLWDVAEDAVNFFTHNISVTSAHRAREAAQCYSEVAFNTLTFAVVSTSSVPTRFHDNITLPLCFCNHYALQFVFGSLGDIDPVGVSFDIAETLMNFVFCSCSTLADTTELAMSGEQSTFSDTLDDFGVCTCTFLHDTIDAQDGTVNADMWADTAHSSCELGFDLIGLYTHFWTAAFHVLAEDTGAAATAFGDFLDGIVDVANSAFTLAGDVGGIVEWLLSLLPFGDEIEDILAFTQCIAAPAKNLVHWPVDVTEANPVAYCSLSDIFSDMLACWESEDIFFLVPLQDGPGSGSLLDPSAGTNPVLRALSQVDPITCCAADLYAGLTAGGSCAASCPSCGSGMDPGDFTFGIDGEAFVVDGIDTLFSLFSGFSGDLGLRDVKEKRGKGDAEGPYPLLSTYKCAWIGAYVLDITAGVAVSGIAKTGCDNWNWKIMRPNACFTDADIAVSCDVVTALMPILNTFTYYLRDYKCYGIEGFQFVLGFPVLYLVQEYDCRYWDWVRTISSGGFTEDNFNFLGGCTLSYEPFTVVPCQFLAQTVAPIDPHAYICYDITGSFGDPNYGQAFYDCGDYTWQTSTPDLCFYSRDGTSVSCDTVFELFKEMGGSGLADKSTEFRTVNGQAGKLFPEIEFLGGSNTLLSLPSLSGSTALCCVAEFYDCLANEDSLVSPLAEKAMDALDLFFTVYCTIAQWLYKLSSVFSSIFAFEQNITSLISSAGKNFERLWDYVVYVTSALTSGIETVTAITDMLTKELGIVKSAVDALRSAFEALQKLVNKLKDIVEDLKDAGTGGGLFGRGMDRLDDDENNHKRDVMPAAYYDATCGPLIADALFNSDGIASGTLSLHARICFEAQMVQLFQINTIESLASYSDPTPSTVWAVTAGVTCVPQSARCPIDPSLYSSREAQRLVVDCAWKCVFEESDVYTDIAAGAIAGIEMSTCYAILDEMSPSTIVYEYLRGGDLLRDDTLIFMEHYENYRVARYCHLMFVTEQTSRLEYEGTRTKRFLPELFGNLEVGISVFMLSHSFDLLVQGFSATSVASADSSRRRTTTRDGGSNDVIGEVFEREINETKRLSEAREKRQENRKRREEKMSFTLSNSSNDTSLRTHLSDWTLTRKFSNQFQYAVGENASVDYFSVCLNITATATATHRLFPDLRSDRLGFHESLDEFSCEQCSHYNEHRENHTSDRVHECERDVISRVRSRLCYRGLSGWLAFLAKAQHKHDNNTVDVSELREKVIRSLRGINITDSTAAPRNHTRRERAMERVAKRLSVFYERKRQRQPQRQRQPPPAPFPRNVTERVKSRAETFDVPFKNRRHHQRSPSTYVRAHELLENSTFLVHRTENNHNEWLYGWKNDDDDNNDRYTAHPFSSDGVFYLPTNITASGNMSTFLDRERYRLSYLRGKPVFTEKNPEHGDPSHAYRNARSLEDVVPQVRSMGDALRSVFTKYKENRVGERVSDVFSFASNLTSKMTRFYKATRVVSKLRQRSKITTKPTFFGSQISFRGKRDTVDRENVLNHTRSTNASVNIDDYLFLFFDFVIREGASLARRSTSHSPFSSFVSALRGYQLEEAVENTGSVVIDYMSCERPQGYSSVDNYTISCFPNVPSGALSWIVPVPSATFTRQLPLTRNLRKSNSCTQPSNIPFSNCNVTDDGCTRSLCSVCDHADELWYDFWKELGFEDAGSNLAFSIATFPRLVYLVTHPRENLGLFANPSISVPFAILIPSYVQSVVFFFVGNSLFLAPVVNAVLPGSWKLSLALSISTALYDYPTLEFSTTAPLLSAIDYIQEETILGGNVVVKSVCDYSYAKLYRFNYTNVVRDGIPEEDMVAFVVTSLVNLPLWLIAYILFFPILSSMLAFVFDVLVSVKTLVVDLFSAASLWYTLDTKIVAEHASYGVMRLHARANVNDKKTDAIIEVLDKLLAHQEQKSEEETIMTTTMTEIESPVPVGTVRARAKTKTITAAMNVERE